MGALITIERIKLWELVEVVFGAFDMDVDAAIASADLVMPDERPVVDRLDIRAIMEDQWRHE